MHALRACGHPGEQRPGVEERGLVRVVLEGHQVEAQFLGEHSELRRMLRWTIDGCNEGPEEQGVTVIRHVPSLGGSCPICKRLISSLQYVRGREGANQ